MAGSGVCCASLEEPQALMKMGLRVLLVGHVNFLLAALVHGVVLRHVNLHKQARAMEYAISNVIALSSGLVAVVVGILAILLSKNKRRRSLFPTWEHLKLPHIIDRMLLTWALFAVSLAAALMAAASAIGLTVAVVRAIMYGGRSLLTHCRFPDAIGYSSVTNECPFDPTRIYSTTLILWVPLVVTCVIQLVFSARCSATCGSFLGLPCCPSGGRTWDYERPRPTVEAPPPRPSRPPRGHDEAPPRRTEPHRSRNERPTRRAEPPRSYNKPPRRATAPPRQHRRTTPPLPLPPPPLPRPPLPPPPQEHPQAQHLPRQHRGRASPERQSLRQPHGERSSRARQEARAGSHQRPPEQHQLLQRGTMERSSFWV